MPDLCECPIGNTPVVDTSGLVVQGKHATAIREFHVPLSIGLGLVIQEGRYDLSRVKTEDRHVDGVVKHHGQELAVW